MRGKIVEMFSDSRLVVGQVKGELVLVGPNWIHEVRVGPNWMDPIVKFLKDDVLPEEKSEAEKIRRNAPRF